MDEKKILCGFYRNGDSGWYVIPLETAQERKQFFMDIESDLIHEVKKKSIRFEYRTRDFVKNLPEV